MVKVYPHNDKFVKCIINKPRFSQAIQIIKSMPVRNYSDQAWYLPVTDVKELNRKLKTQLIDMKIHRGIMPMYTEIIERNKALEFLSENTSGMN